MLAGFLYTVKCYKIAPMSGGHHGPEGFFPASELERDVGEGFWAIICLISLVAIIDPDLMSSSGGGHGHH